MIGHLKPITSHLDENPKKQYQNFYCSMCAELRKKNGLFYGFLLSNELTLVLNALAPYFERSHDTTPCPLTFFTVKNQISRHQAIEVATNIAIILAWIKTIDGQADKQGFWYAPLQKILREKVDNFLPNFSTNFKEILQKYLLFMQESETMTFEKNREFSGVFSKIILEEVALHTQIPQENMQEIATLFNLSGQLIHQADQLIDLESDRKHKQFNPILSNNKGENLLSTYRDFRKEFNLLRKRNLHQLHRLQRLGFVSENFGHTFTQTIHQITAKVHRSKPAFIKVLEKIPDIS